MTELATYIADIKKYTSSVDEAAVAGIVRHLGIALRNRDSSLVAGSDPTELARIRDGFMKKKLALTDDDKKLDASIHQVIEKLKSDRTKSRVTVYYLLAEHYKKLKAIGYDAVEMVAPENRASNSPQDLPRQPHDFRHRNHRKFHH